MGGKEVSQSWEKLKRMSGLGLGAVHANSPVCYERLSMAEFNWV